jgi:hypothetical protein
MEFDVLCQPCADHDDPGSLLTTVCEGCVDRLEEWSEPLGWRGQPEIRHRDAPVAGVWASHDAPAQPLNDRCVAPSPGGWLVLTGDGLVEVRPAGGVRAIGAVDVADEPSSSHPGRALVPALHSSPDGRYAAVVNDHGRHGTVVDTTDGSVVLRLARGSYHCEWTPYPLAFLPGRPVVVAATAWNRLDAFDLPAARSLTERDSSLDYFHGALYPSPSGSRLLDDGWVWSPFGLPRVYDVTAWLGGDVHATEHHRSLSQRAYAWEQPMAWVDDDTVAVQRIGWDDEAMVDGVELYDARSERLVGMFAGPAGRMWARAGRLYVATEAGLEVWSPSDGARVGLVDDFRPLAHDPVTGAFAELDGNRLRSWTPD